MYNPLIQLNHQKSDVLESLRGEIDFWLTQPNHSQKLLATRAGMSPQMLNDIIQHRRGCSPETYEKIVKAIRSNGNRIVGLQESGHKVGKSMELNDGNMAATYARHNDQLMGLWNASRDERNVGTFQDNRNNTKNLSK
jgi:hypothetical protein